MGRLTSRPLYEWEQIAKKRNWDIDKLREAYWDELTAEGRPGVKEQAKRLRGAGLPVDFEGTAEEGPQLPEATHLAKLQGTIARSFPRVAAEQANVLSFLPGPVREATRLGATAGGLLGGMSIEDVLRMAASPEQVTAESGKIIQDKVDRELLNRGFPELEPTTNEQLAEEPLKTIGRFAEKTLAESVPYFAMPYGKFTGMASKTPMAARALEAALFGGGATGSALAEGEAPLEALERGATTGAGVFALGTALSGAGKALRKLIPERAAKPPVAPPTGGLPPGLKSVETNLLVPLAERAEARGDTAMADILRAEYNRRTPESLSQLVERQAGEAPVKTGKITQEGLPELIESQAEADLAKRAAKSGNTVADQRMLEGDAQLQQVEQAATELGVPMPRKGERGFVKTELLTGREKERGGSIPFGRVAPLLVKSDDIKKENFLRDLNERTPVAYRETSIGQAQDILPFSNTFTDTTAPMFVSNDPALALGQGRNRGVIIELDTKGLQSQVNTSKPGWDLLFDNGSSEFVVKYAKQSDLRSAVRSFTVKPDAKVLVKSDSYAMKRIIDNAEKSGWTKTVGPDGSITMTRPDVAGVTGKPGERGFVKTEVLTGREGEKGGTTPVPRVRLGDVLDDDGLRAQDQILDRMETPTGRTLTPAETRVDQKFNGVAQGIANVHSRIESILKAMDETASPEQLENLGQVMGEGMVESGGRMTAPMREARRAAAPPVGRSPDLKISERIEMELKTAITDLETQIKELGGQYSTTAGATVKKLDPVAYERLLQLKRAYDAIGSEWGRIGRIRQESADTMRRLSRDMGLTLNYLHRRVMEERNPIYTNIGRLVRKSKAGQTVEGLVDDVLKRSKGDKELNKQLSGLNEAEQKQLIRDAVDAWRLNLFSVTSFTLDLFGNIAATASEFAHEAGTDLARAVTGKNAVGVVSMLSGLRRAFRKAPTRVEQEFGLASPQGEAIGTGLGWVGKKGTFTERSNAASALIDNAVGLPLYLKGSTDTAFKRAGAWAEIYKQARLEAAKRGLKGAERQKFIEEFSSTMSEADVIKAIDRARRMGFSRELTNLEERMYGSTPYKLFLGAFGRWPSQFVRALGEWVGLSPSLWKRVAAEAKAGNPQEIVGAIGRSLTGLGGLYFLNKTLYPDTDFKSMQYRDPQTGEPIRLAGREPISTGLVLLALMNGDFEKAMDGMKYASIPFANFMAGEGGLLTSLMQRVNSAVKYRKFDSNAVKYELTRTMNKLIPGQAVLGAMKSIFDPTLREGLGADLPVVSEFLPEKIDPTTGKPIEPRQEFPPGSGIEIPQFGNVPIPGAKIIQDPVSNILGLYGMLDYTMPRRPIAGIPVSEIPREFQRRYMEIAGAEMQKQLGPIARRLMTKRGAIPFGDRQNLLEGYKVYDRLTKGGVSPEEAGKQAFSGKYSVEMSWQEKLKWARALLEDKKLIEAKRNDVRKIAVEKLEQEMRRARREGRL